MPNIRQIIQMARQAREAPDIAAMNFLSRAARGMEPAGKGAALVAETVAQRAATRAEAQVTSLPFSFMDATKFGIEAGMNIGKAMGRHPFLTAAGSAAIGSAAIGMYRSMTNQINAIPGIIGEMNVSSTGYAPMGMTSDNLQQDPRQMYATRTMQEQQRFKNSADGLVQGLHQNRHRGR